MWKHLQAIHQTESLFGVISKERARVYCGLSALDGGESKVSVKDELLWKEEIEVKWKVKPYVPSSWNEQR